MKDKMSKTKMKLKKVNSVRRRSQHIKTVLQSTLMDKSITHALSDKRYINNDNALAHI